MQLYAAIKGIESCTITDTVNALMLQLDLAAVANRVAGSLSGGNKRKLSSALAFLGEPPVIFLGTCPFCDSAFLSKFIFGSSMMECKFVHRTA